MPPEEDQSPPSLVSTMGDDVSGAIDQMKAQQGTGGPAGDIEDEPLGASARAEAEADLSWSQSVWEFVDVVKETWEEHGFFGEWQSGSMRHGGRRGAQALAGAVQDDPAAQHDANLRMIRDLMPAALQIMQATNPDNVEEAALNAGRLNRYLNMKDARHQLKGNEPQYYERPAQETGSPVHEERGDSFGDAPNIFIDQRPGHDYRNQFGGFTQVERVAGGIYTAENPPEEMAIDVTRLMDGNVNVLVASRNPTGVTSAGLYDGALGYDYLRDQEGFRDTPNTDLGQRNVGRELVREIDSDGNRTGRAVLGSGFRGGDDGPHPTGVAFHMYPMLREGFAAGVDNFHSLYERTNRRRAYTYEDAQGRLQEVVLENEGIKNVRDLAYIWTATGQPNRLSVFETAIEVTDSSLGKDDDGLEKVDADDLRQSFVITLASTGVEAGGDGVIEHIREITGYDAAEPGDALSTFKTEFQEGMKMATEAGPGRRLVNGVWTGRGRGPNANSIWKPETIDAFFEDVVFTIENGNFYVTMPDRGGTGTIRLRWGRSPSAEAA